MAAEPALHLVVGLGNPGPQYERTRHNVGYRVAEILASRIGARFRTSRTQALVAEGRDGDARLVLAKPTTYMNLSGGAASALVRFYKAPLEAVVVIHDELDLPFGVVRVKAGGGTAGHNGLKSLVSSLGPGFARVRIGIGRPVGRQDPADFVLDPFTKRESAEIDVVLEEAADAVLAVVHEGVAAAQNRYNTARSAPGD